MNPNKKPVMQNKDIRDLNEIGKRIMWCRVKLGLSLTKVKSEINIPLSTLIDRETGVRARYIEEYLVLAQFFNSRWKTKFQQSFPTFGGQEISEVKVSWLMFGVMEE